MDVQHVLCMTMKCHRHEVQEAFPQRQTETFTSGIQEVEFVNAYCEIRAVQAEVLRERRVRCDKQEWRLLSTNASSTQTEEPLLASKKHNRVYNVSLSNAASLHNARPQ